MMHRVDSKGQVHLWVPKRLKMEIQCERCQASVCNFSFLSVNIFRYTEYYIDVRRRTPLGEALREDAEWFNKEEEEEEDTDPSH